MASGSFLLARSEENSSGTYMQGKVEWTAPADQQNNQSTVTAKLYVRKGNDNMTLTQQTWGAWPYALSVAGSQVSGQTPWNTYVLEDWVHIATKTVTVNHEDDGSKSVLISASVSGPTGTSLEGLTSVGSKTVSLDTIPRATTLDSLVSADGLFSGALTYRYTPASADFYNLVELSLVTGGTETVLRTIRLGTRAVRQHTGTIYISTTEQSTIYYALPDDPGGTIKVTIKTYRNSGYTGLVGSSPKTVELLVPDREDTRPDVTLEAAPVSNLPSAFDGIYLQGKTKAAVTVTGQAKFGASVVSTTVQVGSTTYQGQDVTTGFLSAQGQTKVVAQVTDSRQIIGTAETQIQVLPYWPPQLRNASGDTEVVVARCNAAGDLDDTGTYLMIRASVAYAKVESNGEQKNFCLVRYRCRASDGPEFSEDDWVILLERGSQTDQVVSGPLLSGTLAAEKSYQVQLQAVDDVGERTPLNITVPTAKVYMHRDARRRSIAFGKMIEHDDSVEIDEDIKIRLPGDVYTALGYSSYVTGDSSGRTSSCSYRVALGRVSVAFRCTVGTGAGDPVPVNLEPIPVGYRPPTRVYSLCACNAGEALVSVDQYGMVYIERVMAWASGVTELLVDGWIEYHVG